MFGRVLTGIARRILPSKAGRSVDHLLVPSRTRPDAKIEVKRVMHRFDNDVEALKNVNIDVHHGEFVCLLGPSGCGKSTLLYALAGHFNPSGGAITIDGKTVNGPSPDRLLMFQEAALFPWLTVRQNLVFALRGRKKSRTEAERISSRFIDRVELTGFEDALPHQLSGGMKMRVSLARALAMEPAVLLMDEPFGALDAQTRAKMHVLLQDIWMETKKTVVFVTHNVREALILGDRVVVMAGRPGRVLQDLEVRLERPRDPDDDRVVALSRQIREALRTAEAATEPRAKRHPAKQRGVDGLGETDDAVARLYGGPADPLGTGL